MLETLHDLIQTAHPKAQKNRNSGSMVHLHVPKLMQDFYHQQDLLKVACPEGPVTVPLWS